MADQDTHPPMITAMKIPIIKKGEYDIWSMRMRQYICHAYHNLWDIIVNGDLEDEATPSGKQSSPHVPKSILTMRAPYVLIDVLKIHTDSNVADLLTKGFDVTRISMDLRMDKCSPGKYYSSMVSSIDSKEYTITEASVRSKLQLADAIGIHNLSDAEIYAGLATLGYVIEGDIVPLLPAMLAGAAVDQGNTSGSAEDSVQLKELMVLVPKLVTRINSLEKELKDTKQTLGNVVLKLVKKVKTLETALKRKSKKVLISESEGEESEDQGRKFQDIDDDPLVSLVRESMKEKSTDFVTPTKASGEAH
ncbi:hypothetical protein Tco_0620331 [Tanacetum coccineum]